DTSTLNCQVHRYDYSSFTGLHPESLFCEGAPRESGGADILSRERFQRGGRPQDLAGGMFNERAREVVLWQSIPDLVCYRYQQLPSALVSRNTPPSRNFQSWRVGHVLSGGEPKQSVERIGRPHEGC